MRRSTVSKKSSRDRRVYSPNVSTIPITAMGCQQCIPFSVVKLKGKHCQKPYCRNGARTATEMDGTLHTDFQKSETSRDIKKFFWYHLNIFKSFINFQN